MPLSQLGVTDGLNAWSGVAVSAHCVSGMFMMPIWGKLADRYGRKPMLVRAGFSLSLIYFLTSFSTVEHDARGAPGAPGAAHDGSDESPMVLDMSGKYILPGLIDVHVHLRDPGLTHKEDFATGTAAAACGGVTTVFDMPNTLPPVATADALMEKLAAVRERAYVDCGLYGLIDQHNLEELPRLAQAGAIAYKLFLGPTTGDIRAPDWGRLLEVFERVRETGLSVVVHAEDRDVIEYWEARWRATGGVDDYRTYLATRPRFGEAAATQTVCLLARLMETPIHIAHVTISEAVEVIRGAKADGAPVTAETCPPYLTMTVADCERLGPMSKILPPIREQSDQQALWAALRDGTLDMIATDHAPHEAESKLGKSWMRAAGGMIGVETLLPLLLTEAHRGRLTVNQLVDWTSRRPADVFGIADRKGDIRPGIDADLVIVDPNAEYTIEAADLHSKSKNSPLLGQPPPGHNPAGPAPSAQSLRGKVVHTILRGNIIVEDGRLVGEPHGRLISRGGH